MKRELLTLTIFVIILAAYGQFPQGISYQAIVRDNNNHLITNQEVGVRVTLFQGEEMNFEAYQEAHNANTNANGLVSLIIGKGNNPTADFNKIDWSKGPWFIKTETDLQGGTNYTITATSPVLSVPYALYARSAGLSLPIDETVDQQESMIKVTNQRQTDGTIGIWSTVNAERGISIVGTSAHPEGATTGVWGEAYSDQGIGVIGSAISQKGTTVGVRGAVNSPDGYSGRFEGGRFYVEGNVGIGVDEPTAKLDIDGSIRIRGGSPQNGMVLRTYGDGTAFWGFPGVLGLPLDNSNSTTGTLFRITNTNKDETSQPSTAISAVTDSPNGVALRGTANANTGSATAVYGRTFSNNGYSGYFLGGRFYVSGNTGIGTTDPQERLHVNGNILLSGGDRNIINSSTGNNGLGFGTQGEVRMRIASNGNVGIGTTGPGERLHIVGNLRFSGDDRTIVNSSNNALSFGTNNNIRMRISANGNVGIGTTSPTDRLTVSGNTRVDGNIILQGGNRRITNNTSTGSLAMGTNATDRIIVASNGNVRITEQLSVNNKFDSSGVSEYALYVIGNALKTSGGSSWATFSDIRLKTISGAYRRGLKEIAALEPVTFFYKADNPKHISADDEVIGFIAQDVQKVFPEAVTEGSDGYLTLDIHPISVALVNAIKELKLENDSLKKELLLHKLENQDLKSDISDLNDRFQKIENLLLIGARE